MRLTVNAAALLAFGAALLLGNVNGLAQDAASDGPDDASPAAASTREIASPAPVDHRLRLTPSPVAGIAAPSAPGPSSGVRLAPSEAMPTAELEAFVDGAVRDAMASDHIAGVTVAVVQNGQTVLKKGYGFARLNPATVVDPDRTLFRLGPVSHAFTWMVLMKEIEAGHIRPTTPVNVYLPEKLQVKDQGFKRAIYVGDLMSHSAGFEDRQLGQLFEKDPARIRPFAIYMAQERPRRVRESGTLSSRSDYGVALAAEAVAYTTNKPFETLVEQEILLPLGLAHTSFREPYSARADLPTPISAALARDMSDGYRWMGGDFERRPFEYASQIAPAESASSTAGDMARVLLMILNNGQLDNAVIYGPATAAGFRAPPAGVGPATDGWADGFSMTPLPGGFNGQGEEGDTLSFSSSLIAVPALNLGVFVATNTEGGRRLSASLANRIVTRFYAAAPDLPRPGSPTLTTEASAYTGGYLTTRRAYRGLEKFADLLRGWVRISATPDGQLTISGPNVRAQAYVPDGAPDRFRRIYGSGVLTFQMQDGRAARLFEPGLLGSYERTGFFNRLSTLYGLAVLTALASLAILIGLFTRDRRDARQTSTQSRASLLQTTIAVLWLLAMASTALWARGVEDRAMLMYHWPGAALMIASACALVAALLTAMCIVIGPAIWRGGRRVDSWSSGRKLGYTASTAVFAGFSLVLFLWGALQPWSG